MTDLFSLLTKQPSYNDDIVFDDADVREKATECIELAGNGLLAVLLDVDGLHVSFVVFEFHSGPATEDGVVVDGAKWSIVFHGRGPSVGLRELRHTYWGEPDAPGYLFYPDGKLIGDAFRHLQRWFDCGGDAIDEIARRK